MAKLDGVQDFDQHLRRASADLNRLMSTRGGSKGVWSDKQEVEFSQLIGAVAHLHDAISTLVAHNR
jgi:hypothetical protein